MSQSHRQTDNQSRRETFIYLIVPLMLTVVTVLLVILIILLLPNRLQVALIADWMTTLLILCPLALCGFLFAVIALVSVAFMSRSTTAVRKPIRRLAERTHSLADRVTKTTDSVNNVVVSGSSRFAYWERFLKVFDPPPKDDQSKEDVDV